MIAAGTVFRGLSVSLHIGQYTSKSQAALTSRADVPSSNTDQLCSLVGEASLYHDSPESHKLRKSETIRNLTILIGSKSARILPVFESDVALLSSSSVYADAEYKEADDGNDFDHGEPMKRGE